MAGGVAEAFAEFEAFAADRQQPGRRRRAVLDIGVDLEHRLRTHGVGGEAVVAHGFDAGERAGRRRVEAGIDEQHAATSLQVERMFDLELEIGEAFDLAPFRMAACEFGEMFYELRAQRIIAAAGIAPAEDQCRRGQGMW